MSDGDNKVVARRIRGNIKSCRAIQGHRRVRVPVTTSEQRQVQETMWDGTYVHHGWILFTTLDELAIGNIRILVLVHASKYLFHPLGSIISARLA